MSLGSIPFALNIPLLWALGSAWRMRISGALLMEKPMRRLFLIYAGDLVGVWLHPEDPALSPGSRLQMVFSIRPRYLRGPVWDYYESIVRSVWEIARLAGPDVWGQFIERLVRDTVLRHPDLIWQQAPHAVYPEDIFRVSTIDLLFRLAQEQDPAILGQGDERTPDPSLEELVDARDHLLKDINVPSHIQQFVTSMNFIELSPSAHAFLSFFTAPPLESPVEKAVKTLCRKADEPEYIELERYLGCWQDLRVFAHQSKRWTHYQVLGCRATDDEEVIRQRYFTLRVLFHPDRHHDIDDEQYKILQTLFIRIKQAYNVLSNPARRRAYDQSLISQVVEIVKDRQGQVDQKTFRSYVLRGLKALVEENFEESVRWLESAREGMTDWPIELLLALAESFSLQHRRRAAQRFERLTQAHEDRPEVWWAYAAALYHWKFYSRAQNALDRLRRLDPSLLSRWGSPEQPRFRGNREFVSFFWDYVSEPI